MTPPIFLKLEAMKSLAVEPLVLNIARFFTALIVTTLLTPLVISYAKKKRIFDQPDTSADSSRKVHTNPTPRLGGMAMVLGFVAALPIGFQQNTFFYEILASFLFFLLGFYDDLKNLSAKFRLAAQVGIALLAVIPGDLVLERIYLTPWLFFNIPYWGGVFLSVFVIVGAVNAANMIDGLDGLAGGIILVTLTLISYLLFIEYKDSVALAYLGLPLAGAILGFLKYNTHPASIFMGDGGSNWLGFFSGVFILIAAGAATTPAAAPGAGKAAPLVSVLLCFALPILDTLFVITARILKGISPLFPDKLHMHHGLMKLGLSQIQTVTLMYFLAIILGLTGILPFVFPKFVGWWISYLAPVIFLLLLFYILKKEKSAAPKTPLYSLLLGSGKATSLQNKLAIVFGLWERFNRFILYFILIITPIITGGIKNPFVGYLAGAVFVILGILSVAGRKGSGSDFMHSFMLVMGALILLVANNQKVINVILMDKKYLLSEIYNLIFIVLTISILLYILFTFQKRYLLVTPTDFLMLLFPLLLLLMPPEFRSQWNLNIIAMRGIVLFVAIRTLIKRHEDFADRLRLIIMISLLFIFMTGALGMKIVY